jgi:hypothetical protein
MRTREKMIYITSWHMFFTVIRTWARLLLLNNILAEGDLYGIATTGTVN